jgi:hypothetical protein
MTDKCKSTVVFGDDHGDNCCTFHCELEEGHEGDHRETGTRSEAWPYDLTWKGDMTEKPPTECYECGSTNLTPHPDENIFHDWQMCLDCKAEIVPVAIKPGIVKDEAEK